MSKKRGVRGKKEDESGGEAGEISGAREVREEKGESKEGNKVRDVVYRKMV